MKPRSRSRVDVERLLERLGIRGTRRGRALWSPCPSKGHREKDPSWSIIDAVGHPKHGNHHCFGCGFEGGPRALVREVLGLGRCECQPRKTCAPCRKAAEYLAGGPSHEMPDEIPEVEIVRPAGPPVLEMPPEVEFGPPASWPSTFRRYALEPPPVGRGLTEAQIERWGIGYAVAGRLEMRLVIPIRDPAGKLQSYAARTLVGAEERYMTPLRSKGANPAALFGRQHWPLANPSGRLPGTLFLTEGALDALAVERALHGAPIAAVMGSDPTSAAVNRLATWPRIVVASDADKAGDKLWDLLRGKLAGSSVLVRAALPAGADPASLPADELSAALRAAVARLPGPEDPGDDPDRPPF